MWLYRSCNMYSIPTLLCIQSLCVIIFQWLLWSLIGACCAWRRLPAQNPLPSVSTRFRQSAIFYRCASVSCDLSLLSQPCRLIRLKLFLGCDWWLLCALLLSRICGCFGFSHFGLLTSALTVSVLQDSFAVEFVWDITTLVSVTVDLFTFGFTASLA